MALAAGASVSVLRAHTPFQRNEASDLFCNSGYPVRESEVVRLGVLGSNPKLTVWKSPFLSLGLDFLHQDCRGLGRMGLEGL